jgi:hypothetical protein
VFTTRDQVSRGKVAPVEHGLSPVRADDAFRINDQSPGGHVNNAFIASPIIVQYRVDIARRG